MIDASNTEIWIVITALGVGTYLFRLSFLGLIGDRELPPWLLRLLRFTPVAVLPAVIAPMIIPTNGTSLDPLQLIAATATLVVGFTTRNVLYAIVAGFALFFGLGAFVA